MAHLVRTHYESQCALEDVFERIQLHAVFLSQSETRGADGCELGHGPVRALKEKLSWCRSILDEHLKSSLMDSNES